jgi:hypothetical protein
MRVLVWFLAGAGAGIAVALVTAFCLAPCEECGRGLWRWHPYILINNTQRQVLVRPFRWAWSDVMAKTAKLSGYRKLYLRWVLRGPFEIRVWRTK